MAEALKDTITQSLECPVCLTTFTDPKILSCSHTYCKACLDILYECLGDDCKIRCPVCRNETPVPNQDVNALPGNLVLKNLMEDIKNQHHRCTNCKTVDTTDVYCQDCGKYLCINCHSMHTKWEDFIGHEIVAISDITSGKVTVRTYQKCKKHPREDEEIFCRICRKFACYKCVPLEHTGEGHRNITAGEYEQNYITKINDLKSKVYKKCFSFKKYVKFINDQKELVSNAQDQCLNDIQEAYDTLVQQLTEKKELPEGEVKDRVEGVKKELDEMKRSAQCYITLLTTLANLITNKAKAPLDLDTLAVHDTLCEDLLEALNEKEPDYDKPLKLSKKGKIVMFHPFEGNLEMPLGKIVEVVAKNTVNLPSNNNHMNIIARTPDGRMLVGCKRGGEMFTADGHLQESILKDVDIRGVGFLSDNRCAVIDGSNNITIYTPEYRKLNVEFGTLSKEEGGFSNLTVDGDDQIYVSYRKAKKIQVFSPAGGKADVEIANTGYEVMQINTYNDFLLTANVISVRLIDKDGAVKHRLRKASFYTSTLYPAVSLGNKILIAEVKHNRGLVSIDEYTDHANELEHVQNIVSDYKFEKPGRVWYYLEQYLSGEIAFCTTDRLYIFH
ncbi:tripartite motif-containing protein 2-like [Lytechinus variegatus]|uniref:tripartite motif-containing protein 2-like n=1 Tax=Lytechinus variegatus TaxID=7654 RepID=UPI001BB0E276|nr:tripartite motif-containing protein 2-like [Lytechinus variegatus]